MIGRLVGYLMGSDPAVVMAGQVGYEVAFDKCGAAVGETVHLWIHEHAPQDSPHELYGFRELADRDLFRRLLNVQGVGPKVAMRIVANAGVTREGIVVPATLRAIRGVGPKIVQNITDAFS